MREGFQRRDFTPQRAELRLSIRKVTNGYSIKVSDSTKEEDVGKVFIASSVSDLLAQTRAFLESYEEDPIRDNLDI